MLIALSATAASSDQNEKIPSGSYLTACVDISMHGNDLRALCPAQNGDWLTSEVHNPTGCVGGVYNLDGRLTCKQGAGPPGTYILSCKDVSVRKHTLLAQCMTALGKWVSTSLKDFQSCRSTISNEDGHLMCKQGPGPPGSTYIWSCEDVSVREHTLLARCKTILGKWLSASLKDFQSCRSSIDNEDGHLVCEPQTSDGPSFEGGTLELDRLLDPGLPTPPTGWQLERDTWTFKDGAPGDVLALARTSDGYLWLGGFGGLFRFDGRQFELFHSPFGEELLSTIISSLYTPPSGGLWIGYGSGGASFLDEGRLKNYGGDFATKSGRINAIVQDKDGNVWAGGTGGLWRLNRSAWERIGTEWNVRINAASDLKVDRDGNVWTTNGVPALTSPTAENIVLCLRRGSRQFQVVRQSLPFSSGRFGNKDRLVDQEGSVWVGGLKGLDRFYYSPLVKQELAEGFYSMGADNHGVVWIDNEGRRPLIRVVYGKTQVQANFQWLNADVMYRAPDTTLWLGSSAGALWHETLSHRRPSRDPKQLDGGFGEREILWRFTGREWDVFGLPSETAGNEQLLRAIAQDRTGGLWVSFGINGLYRLADGVWTSYGGRKDLPTTGVECEFTDSLGRVWFGYAKNQLAVLDGDRVQVLGPSDGLRVGNVTAIHGRGPKVWIGGEFGLEEFDAGHLKNINAVNDGWLRRISGIVETDNGDLWLNCSSGILHVHQSELEQALRNPSYKVKGDHFGRRNGLQGFATQLWPLPSVIEGTDGRLWFAVSNGVVSLDPTHSEHRVVSPPITIEAVSADGKFYTPGSPVRFPPHTSDVQIGYAAVSLSDPEAIHFRYKLEETDPDWHEVAAASPVTYRNLAPGLYHFRANATDTNGVWLDKVASMEFSILPAFYQTAWFRFLGVAAFFALLWALYQLRLRQLATQYNARLEERVSERTRIARDLHDTLLQSFHGSMLRFQAASNLFAKRPAEAKLTLDSAIDEAAQAITEGRDAIQGLRVSRIETDDIALAIKNLGEEVAACQTNENSAVFHVNVAGTPRNLQPIPRDEVYGITAEALRNAFRHAEARRIEVEIRYDDHELLLRVRDDGKGIDPDVLQKGGQAGHYGLRGISERARLVGGQLNIWSNIDAGTELELSLPASIAYAKSPARLRSWLSRVWTKS